jgi:SagB-type dehydrogenase family enzyme
MLLLLIGLLGALRQGESTPRQSESARQIVTLPPPTLRGPVSVEEALRLRRSVRTSALPPGVYHYRPRQHDLVRLDSGEDRRSALAAAAALGKRWVAAGAAMLVFTAVYERTTVKYGDSGVRYVNMEVGHAAQNVYLQAAALHIGSVFVGAFRDTAVARLLGLPDAAHPLGLMPMGRIP